MLPVLSFITNVINTAIKFNRVVSVVDYCVEWGFNQQFVIYVSVFLLDIHSELHHIFHYLTHKFYNHSIILLDHKPITEGFLGDLMKAWNYFRK